MSAVVIIIVLCLCLAALGTVLGVYFSGVACPDFGNECPETTTPTTDTPSSTPETPVTTPPPPPPAACTGYWEESTICSVTGCGQTGVYTDTYIVPRGSGPCTVGSGTRRQTRSCSTPACAPQQQLTPIQRFSMDWGKAARGSYISSSNKRESAPDCATRCVNTPNCVAFDINWSNEDGSLGNTPGWCSLYSTGFNKLDANGARAVYTKNT